MIKFRGSPHIVEYTIQDISEVSALFVKMIRNEESQIFGFKGDLGAGKTTLIKEIIKQLGVRDLVKSPTYSIQCDYHGSLDGKDIIVHHWDLYRISELEAVEMYDQYLSEKSTLNRILFIEWAERLGANCPDLTQINISEVGYSSDSGVEKAKEDIHERRIIHLNPNFP